MGLSKFGQLFCTRRYFVDISWKFFLPAANRKLGTPRPGISPQIDKKTRDTLEDIIKAVSLLTENPSRSIHVQVFTTCKTFMGDGEESSLEQIFLDNKGVFQISKMDLIPIPSFLDSSGESYVQSDSGIFQALIWPRKQYLFPGWTDLARINDD